MKSIFNFCCLLGFCLVLNSCVSNKKFTAMQTDLQSELETTNQQLGKCGEDLNSYMSKLTTCENKAKADVNQLQSTLKLKEEQVQDL